MNPPPPPGPPPLPDVTPRTAFAHQAARAALFAPLIGLVMCLIAFNALRHTPNQAASTVVGIAMLVLVAIGLVSALMALVGIRRHGRRGLLGWGLSGLAVNGLLVGATIANFNAARAAQKSQAALKEVQAASEKFREDMRQAYDPKNGITNVNLTNYDRMRSQFEQAAQQISGDDGLFAKAMAAHLSRTREAMAQYDSGLRELKAAAVLDSATLTNQSQFEPRREVVNRFLAANAKFKEFISNAEQLIRDDLVRMKVTARKLDGYMTGYHSRAGEINLLVLKVRRTDDQMGNAMLGALKVLEDSWGHWRYSARAEQVVFDDNATLEAFNGHIHDLQNASAEQLRLQQQVIKLQQAAK